MAARNRSLNLKPGRARQVLTLTHPNAAGIDIGSASHYVAVPPDRDDEPVREFKSFTADLHALADWLQACGVDTVAMESTGVYWIPLYELLDRRGFTVLLVNARHVKNVSGRKSDVLDCQWLQQLMTYGLLRGAFRPADAVCALRSLSRQREMLLKSQGRQVQHMQKALTQMNIQLANVISDVVGETGQKILRAIVAGERDGQVLAAMKNVRIRATTEEIAKSLEGNWRAEHLFALKQALAAFDFIGTQLAECDCELAAQLASLQAHAGTPAKGKRRGRARNAPKFDLRAQLFQMCGVDLTRIDGIDVTTALVVVSEVGTDMSRFPTVKHFACWLGLCPGTKITGGKVLSGKTKRCANRAAQALRLAAAALRSSQSALGAYFRRMCARMDKPKAVTAAAHKLARLIYTMLTKGEEYTDQGQDYYEERYRQRVLRQLSQRAEKLGMKLVVSEQPA
ncbi:MAG TPA: IS110 family transposase [Rhodocyclaceae bacterium]|uniref:IS110 family transposase n=1 Tax=Accumulibacter sp. TaxID=2053492 RepID=UPI001A5F6DEB|nr:IS110 family transposase [Accumulibacter sp.]MBL8440036.1 IS110 family transposase [Betaproteobacteria bacterium]HMW65265.1 IS110 family transposase [Accumulibacter sp.]HMZ78038.1 IS110 family transposase [Rhodocyclaceae bacterium]